MTKRTDPHRTGAIVPENYTYVASYALPTSDGGWPVPGWRINCEIERRREERDDAGKLVRVINGEHDADGLCCMVAMLHIARLRFSEHGGTGKCSVCGAHFGTGDVWRHNPTGEHINIGHNCADKYEMLAERGDFDAAMVSRDRARAAHRLAEENRKAVESFCADHPGLADDLAVEHHIISDIAAKLRRFHSISDKQVALVRKIAAEARNPPPAEKHVDAPEGRVVVRGKVVSTKVDEMYGGVKMTVKVETPAGSWLAWGTAPSAILGNGLKGCEVEFTATLKRGRDPHFAILSRPTKARIVSMPEAA